MRYESAFPVRAINHSLKTESLLVESPFPMRFYPLLANREIATGARCPGDAML